MGYKRNQKFAVHKAVRKAMKQNGKDKAIDWKHVNEYINKCEEHGGAPMYRTTYGKKIFPDPHNPSKFMVLFICYDGGWSQYFNNVPLSELERIRKE